MPVVGLRSYCHDNPNEINDFDRYVQNHVVDPIEIDSSSMNDGILDKRDMLRIFRYMDCIVREFLSFLFFFGKS